MNRFIGLLTWNTGFSIPIKSAHWYFFILLLQNVVLKPTWMVSAKNLIHFTTCGIILKWSSILKRLMASNVMQDFDWFQLTDHRKRVCYLKMSSGIRGEFIKHYRPLAISLQFIQLFGLSRSKHSKIWPHSKCPVAVVLIALNSDQLI